MRGFAKTTGANEAVLKARDHRSRKAACWRWFTDFFPRGFRDPKYLNWERGYKEAAHLQWNQVLNRVKFNKLLKDGRFEEIAQEAVRIESRTNLLFSFEKMALRDATRENAGARVFAKALFELLHGRGPLRIRFEAWCEAVESLPRRQTRVATHPVVTVFPFLADPTKHIFLKPNVTKRAAEKYGFEFNYHSRPSWHVYSQLLDFGRQICTDMSAKDPQDLIDIQSFIWVIGSDEYQEMAVQRP